MPESNFQPKPISVRVATACATSATPPTKNIAPRKIVTANAAGAGASTAKKPAMIMTTPNIVTQRATRVASAVAA
jgi:hypothetical protein